MDFSYFNSPALCKLGFGGLLSKDQAPAHARLADLPIEGSAQRAPPGTVNAPPERHPDTGLSCIGPS